MLIRALKTTTGHPKGSVYEVDAATGKELIALGYAIEELPIAKQEAAPVAANDNIPFEIAPTGGLTGADAPQSLSPEGQVQKTPTCPPYYEDEGQSERSPSTTDTDSANRHPEVGQTSSTPATTTGGKRKRGRPHSKG